MAYNSKTVTTQIYEGQKPGTSGLRKAVKVFQQPNYTENFVQSILNVLGDKLAGCTLIVGGDGRFFCKEAVGIIISMCAANGVGGLLVGQNGILSTPAASCLIRKHQTAGGIILTASHNPGGPDADFGIKFNTSNGGPAPDAVTNQIHATTTSIAQYLTTEPAIACDLSQVGKHTFFVDGGRQFVVEVVDPVADYLALMGEIFDFPAIRNLLTPAPDKPTFKLLLNSMHGGQQMNDYRRK